MFKKIFDKSNIPFSLIVPFGFLVFFLLLFSLVDSVHAMSAVSYFPMTKNQNDTLPDDLIYYLDQNFGSSYYIFTGPYPSTGNGYNYGPWVSLYLQPKSLGPFCASIDDINGKFSLYNPYSSSQGCIVASVEFYFNCYSPYCANFQISVIFKSGRISSLV